MKRIFASIIDIGIGNTAIVADKLADFPLVLVGSPALDAQARDLTTPHQQKDLCFLCDSSNSLYKQALWGTLAARDILLKNHLVMGSISAITQCVLNGLGIAVLPEFAVERQLHAGELCAINVPLSPEHITSICSRHKNKWLSPAMRLFIQLVRERML